VAEDKVDRLEARTALLQPEAVVAAAEPVAQPEAAVAAAEPVAQQQAVAEAEEPVEQQQVAAEAEEPVAQQQVAAAAAEPVAQQQVAAAAAAVMQPGVRPLAASVELAEMAVVRLWFREASFSVRAPEWPMVPAAV
jgi:hypothetical protein